jgi:hypothetical protein
MKELANSELFFVIAGIALIIITLLLVITLIYLIGILRSIRKTLTLIDGEVESVIGDIEVMRQSIKEKASSVSSIIGAILSALVLRGISGKKKK